MSETNEGTDDEIEVDLVEFETVGTDDEGDIVIDDVVVATDREGHIIAVDETVAVVNARGDVVMDETVSVVGDDGELHVLEVDVTIMEPEKD
jgi:hypothetical protein